MSYFYATWQPSGASKPRKVKPMPIRDGESLSDFEARLKRTHAEPPAPMHVDQMSPTQLAAWEAEHSLNGRSPMHAPPAIPTERRQRAVDPKAAPVGHAAEWSQEDADRWAAANGVFCMLHRNRY